MYHSIITVWCEFDCDVQLLMHTRKTGKANLLDYIQEQRCVHLGFSARTSTPSPRSYRCIDATSTAHTHHHSRDGTRTSNGSHRDRIAGSAPLRCRGIQPVQITNDD